MTKHVIDPNYDPLLDGDAGTKATAPAHDDKAMTAAMMSLDTDVELPGRVRAASVTGNLLGLTLGETFVKAMEVPQDSTLAEVAAATNSYKDQLRQSVNSSIRHARKYEGRLFSMESAMVMYPSGRIFIQVAVTRTA